MKYFRSILCLMLGLCCSAAYAQAPPAVPPAAVSAAPVAAPPLNPAQAQQVLDVLQNDARRTQFINTLEYMARALPPPAAAAPAAAVAVPIHLAPGSLGADVLETVSQHLGAVSKELADTAEAVNHFPLVWIWLQNIAQDPDTRWAMLDAAWKLVVILGAAALAERLATSLLRGWRHLLDRRPPGMNDTAPPSGQEVPPGEQEDATAQPKPSSWGLLRRLPFALLRLLLELIPVAAFAILAIGLLATPVGTPASTRLVLLAVVKAYLLCQVLICLVRMVLAPSSPGLRLVHVANDTASYLTRWLRRILVVAIFGDAVAEVTLLFGLYIAAYNTLLKLVALVVHVFLVIIVLQCRVKVSRRLRPAPGSHGFMALLRERTADSWHYMAIFYIVALWLVWALEVQGGFARLMHFFLATIIVLALARVSGIVLLGGLDRLLEAHDAEHHPGSIFRARAQRYHRLLRGLLIALIAVVAAIALLQAWGLDALSWFSGGAIGDRIISAAVAIGITIGLALLIWEASNAAVERKLATLAKEGQLARSARLRTLMPMLRSVLFVSVSLMAGLTVLSQVGLNTAPLLAGAGVAGVAIGFGSQKLVQDVITGLFLLLENAMQVGDTVSLAGLTGTVENLSIRTIRLRALDGSVHIIPFSAVTSVTNMTRDYSYAMTDVSVGLNEEPDGVIEVLKELAQEMREEPAWRLILTDDLEVMGVDKFIDTAWVLRVRIKTLPTKRWAVQREFNRRIKYLFDRMGIESPITSYKVLSNLPAPPAAEPAQVQEPTS
jgi:small-conductance mechanosensitive channel